MLSAFTWMVSKYSFYLFSLILSKHFIALMLLGYLVHLRIWEDLFTLWTPFRGIRVNIFTFPFIFSNFYKNIYN